jgi:hypothetical protein
MTKLHSSADMTREEFAQYFSAYVQRTFGRLKAAARHYGVSGSMISMVASGLKPPTEAMLKEIGVTRKVVKTEIYEVNNGHQTQANDEPSA